MPCFPSPLFSFHVAVQTVLRACVPLYFRVAGMNLTHAAATKVSFNLSFRRFSSGNSAVGVSGVDVFVAVIRFEKVGGILSSRPCGP